MGQILVYNIVHTCSPLSIGIFIESRRFSIILFSSLFSKKFILTKCQTFFILLGIATFLYEIYNLKNDDPIHKSKPTVNKSYLEEKCKSMIKKYQRSTANPIRTILVKVNNKVDTFDFSEKEEKVKFKENKEYSKLKKLVLGSPIKQLNKKISEHSPRNSEIKYIFEENSKNDFRFFEKFIAYAFNKIKIFDENILRNTYIYKLIGNLFKKHFSNLIISFNNYSENKTDHIKDKKDKKVQNNELLNSCSYDKKLESFSSNDLTKNKNSSSNEDNSLSTSNNSTNSIFSKSKQFFQDKFPLYFKNKDEKIQ